ncbi:hypothetical protein Franean1_1475 [Parafrankia sp. EAN1pec]|nr:hypothetical protein Franean1_1475 [Frankia sp. EAN1pec]
MQRGEARQIPLESLAVGTIRWGYKVSRVRALAKRLSHEPRRDPNQSPEQFVTDVVKTVTCRSGCPALEDRTPSRSRSPHEAGPMTVPRTQQTAAAPPP